MAEGKESFLLNKNIVHLLDKMPDEMAGKLFKVILSYVNDRNPVVEDLTINMAFIPIKVLIDSDWEKNNPGELHWNWKGGVTVPNRKIRNGARIRRWRKEVLQRDNHTCQHCGQHRGKLHVHHILSFANFPDSRYELTNGLTLCRPCHINIHRTKK